MSVVVPGTVNPPVIERFPVVPASVIVSSVFVPSSKTRVAASSVMASASSVPSIVSSSRLIVTVSVALVVAVRCPSVRTLSVSPSEMVWLVPVSPARVKVDPPPPEESDAHSQTELESFHLRISPAATA